MTVELSAETESRLRGLAARQGIDAAEYARKLIESALPLGPADQATLDLLDQWDREKATDDPEEIARRQADVKAFMDGMNRNRLEMEGPLSRPIYP